MVNYPNGKKNTWTSAATSAGRRGMDLEADINATNSWYLSENRAVIHKKPTPVQIVKVDYPKRSAAKISEAYFKLPSTTDYNGIYRGKYIDFEAKECASATSFPFKSIHMHQITHLEKVIEHGAIAFVLMRFTKFNETYLVPADVFIHLYRTSERSSAPYKWFIENGYPVSGNYVKPIDYLNVVDQIFFKDEEAILK